jgi:transposase
MAKRQFQLSEQECKTFQEAERQTRDAYELKRLQAVRLYGSGTASAEIRRLVCCGERSIRQWSQHYRQGGLAGLKSHWQGENALKLSRAQRAELKQRLHNTQPDQIIQAEVRISQGQFWTVSDLQVVIQQWYGVEYATRDSYQRLLEESGFSYQRTEKVYRSRPDAQTVADFEAELEKKWSIFCKRTPMG